MAQTVSAIYENGVLRPLEKLDLEEREQVEIVIHTRPGPKTDTTSDAAADDPLAGLRVATGIADLAEHFDDYRFGRRMP
jgi:predicted DNA-binding antitoxin AbrB/MazE fold protein